MADVLVDTDVFIDHLRGSAELKPGRNRLHYSVVTRAELFAGNSAGQSPHPDDEESERLQGEGPADPDTVRCRRDEPGVDGMPVRVGLELELELELDRGSPGVEFASKLPPSPP